MTLEEAIRYCIEVMNENLSKVPGKIYPEDEWTEEQEQCNECAEKHAQLVKLLRELRTYRNAIKEMKKWINSNNRGNTNCMEAKADE